MHTVGNRSGKRKAYSMRKVWRHLVFLGWRKGAQQVTSLLSANSWGEAYRRGWALFLDTDDRTYKNYCTRESSERALDWISLLWGCSEIGRGFLIRCLMLHACQHSRSIWIMPLIICFNYLLALKWSGNWTQFYIYPF